MSTAKLPPAANPCPFCGGVSYGEYGPAMVHVRAFKQRHWQQCANVRCNARGPVRFSRDNAIIAWNRRKAAK